MTSRNIGTYSRDATSNPSPALTAWPHRARQGQARPRGVNCAEHHWASPSLSVSVAQRGAVAAFECSHKTDRKAVVLLVFCDSEPDTADGKVEYCSSGPAAVGYPHQTHLLHLEWKFHGYLRKQMALRFHCCPLSSWVLCGYILNEKKKTVTPRRGRKLLYKGKCHFV